MDMPYPYSSFFNEAVAHLEALAAADPGVEATPEYYVALEAAAAFLARLKGGPK